MKKLLPLFTLLLTGCAGTAVPSTVVVCQPVTTWTEAQQQSALADERALKADSVLIPMLSDYADMRTKARECAR